MRGSTIERFLSRVQRSPVGCWEWTGSTDKNGYGQIWDKGRLVYAHRWAYEFYREDIPAGFEPDHLCLNPLCCNPAHLESVMKRVNILRGTSPIANNARKAHCPQGHPYNAENTRIRRGSRECRACLKISKANWQRRRRVRA